MRSVSSSSVSFSPFLVIEKDDVRGARQYPVGNAAPQAIAVVADQVSPGRVRARVRRRPATDPAEAAPADSETNLYTASAQFFEQENTG